MFNWLIFWRKEEEEDDPPSGGWPPYMNCEDVSIRGTNFVNTDDVDQINIVHLPYYPDEEE